MPRHCTRCTQPTTCEVHGCAAGLIEPLPWLRKEEYQPMVRRVPRKGFTSTVTMSKAEADGLDKLKVAVRAFLDAEGYATPADAARDGGVLVSHLQAVWDALGEPDPWKAPS